MNRKSTMATLTGLMFVALTLSIAPAQAENNNIRPIPFPCDQDPSILHGPDLPCLPCPIPRDTQPADLQLPCLPPCDLDPVIVTSATLLPCIPCLPRDTVDAQHIGQNPCKPPCIPREYGEDTVQTQGERRHCHPPCVPNGEVLPLGVEGQKHCRPPCEPNGDVEALGRNGDHPCKPPRDPCKKFDLEAHALEGGAIHLTYNLPDDARGVRILRDSGDGYEFIGGVPNTSEEYLDEDTVIGTPYAYKVEVWYPDSDGPRFYCKIEVTSVPVFGNILASGLAIGLGMLAYVGARRRF